MTNTMIQKLLELAQLCTYSPIKKGLDDKGIYTTDFEVHVINDYVHSLQDMSMFYKNDIVEHLELLFGVDIEIARFHKFYPESKCIEHVDNAWPNNDTYIINLSQSESRLTVNGELVNDNSWIHLPEGTPHSVVEGSSIRYTLSFWGKLSPII